MGLVRGKFTNVDGNMWNMDLTCDFSPFTLTLCCFLFQLPSPFSSAHKKNGPRNCGVINKPSWSRSSSSCHLPPSATQQNPAIPDLSMAWHWPRMTSVNRPKPKRKPTSNSLPTTIFQGRLIRVPGSGGSWKTSIFPQKTNMKHENHSFWREQIMLHPPTYLRVFMFVLRVPQMAIFRKSKNSLSKKNILFWCIDASQDSRVWGSSSTIKL